MIVKNFFKYFFGKSEKKSPRDANFNYSVTMQKCRLSLLQIYHARISVDDRMMTVQECEEKNLKDMKVKRGSAMAIDEQDGVKKI